MTPDPAPGHWEKVRDLFDRASDLPHGQRTEFLRRECAGDEALRADVGGLLSAITQSSQVMDGWLGEAVQGAITADAITAGSRLGPYQILEKLGEGGMGQVFRARRGDEVFQKEVAIKLVPAAFASPALVERFRAERRILAALDHPNIARVLDGGSSSAGAPYLVMEYIDGLPLQQHCLTRALSSTERVRLFRSICDAVQYAHENLIVHRDLKPANVIVTADGTAKLLDFGIAKLLDPAQDTGAPQTRPFERMMTPEYASPEQIRGEAVTTATDVYSLGVMLYELLSGERPFALSGVSLGEMERVVCEKEARPLGELHRNLAGDLENIVAKAMQKNPALRYRSAGALAEDLGRYLDGFPVLARPESATYRAGKFVRRHKLAVTAMLGAVAALLGFVTLLIRERNATDRERAAAERVVQFLVKSFEVADPSRNQGKVATARDILDNGVARIDAELRNQPETMGRMLTTMGEVYHVIGEQKLAQRLLERAVDLPASPNQRAAAWKGLGQVQSSNGDYTSSEASLRKAISAWPEGSIERADAEAALAETLRLQSRFDEAEAVVQRALTTLRERRGGNHPDTAHCLGIWAQIRHDRRDMRGAIERYQQALAMERRAFGPIHRRIAVRLNNLASVQVQSGQFREAEASLLQAIAILTKLYGIRQQDLATVWSDLGVAYSRQSRFPESEHANREALRIYQSLHGRRHPFVAVSLTNLAQLLRRQGKPLEALPIAAEGLQVNRETTGPDSLGFAFATFLEAQVLLDLDRLNEAEPKLREAARIRSRFQGPTNETVLMIDALSALVRQRKGDWAGARTIYQAIADATTGPAAKPSNSRVTALAGLAEGAAAAGDWDQVEKALPELLPFDKGNVQLRARIQLLLGRLHLARRRPAEAEAALQRAAAVRQPDAAYFRKEAEGLLARLKR